jgi:hypothetical protein
MGIFNAICGNEVSIEKYRKNLKLLSTMWTTSIRCLYFYQKRSILKQGVTGSKVDYQSTIYLV